MTTGSELQRRIDEKIAKLQALKSLASDPEMMAELRSLVEDSGSGMQSTAANPPKMARGELKTAIQNQINRFTGWSYFDAATVVEEMVKTGFTFNDARPKVAVTKTLLRFATEGLLEIAERGSGTRPTRFRFSSSGEKEEVQEAASSAAEHLGAG